MKNSFDDIRERLGEPQWFDENGVPRYCDFAPGHCGVYSQCVAFIDIRCQLCHARFAVAAVVALYDVVVLPEATGTGSFHYGDPPSHGCIGDTMNSEALQIREFWRRDQDILAGWQRDATFELTYPEGAYD
jgi:hypothetical protein